jgi:hypothetical protein
MPPGHYDTTPLCLRLTLGLGQGCQACCVMSITSVFNFWLARDPGETSWQGAVWARRGSLGKCCLVRLAAIRRRQDEFCIVVN